MTEESKAKLIIRTAKTKDIKAICALSKRVYPAMPDYQESMVRGQINSFKEGHFVAEYNQEIVGYCASIRLNEDLALKKHTWKEASGGGYGVTHDPEGEYLYGYEIFVDPKFRRHKIGARFYNARKKLCEYHRLKGIVYGGRVPGFSKNKKYKNDIKAYVEKVKLKEIRDQVLSFQLRNGFEILGILEDYLPTDKLSKGYAVHLLWKNPKYVENKKTKHAPMGRIPNSVRISVVQYQQRSIKSFDEFAQIVTYFVDCVANYQSDFVLFPEFLTLNLLSIENKALAPHESVAKLCDYKDDYVQLFSKLAIDYNINIIGGSHPERIDENTIQNIAYVFLRDGSIHKQPKIHPTPDEEYWWNIKGGDYVHAIDTDCGRIGVLICYDSEFPELARHLVNQGVQIIFVPFLTDERQSYNRVRYCCQARAVENQCYVAMAGNVGNLPRVNNMEVHYAQSCILTPCDFPFARDGIASETTVNTETVAIADLELDLLNQARNSGTVQNLSNRRHDLYTVKWYGK